MAPPLRSGARSAQGRAPHAPRSRRACRASTLRRGPWQSADTGGAVSDGSPRAGKVAQPARRWQFSAHYASAPGAARPGAAPRVLLPVLASRSAAAPWALGAGPPARRPRPSRRAPRPAAPPPPWGKSVTHAFVNDRSGSVAHGATVREAVAQFDHGLADLLDQGAAVVTDGVGGPGDGADPASEGGR